MDALNCLSKSEDCLTAICCRRSLLSFRQIRTLKHYLIRSLIRNYLVDTPQNQISSEVNEETVNTPIGF
jgi:hypothetical protein